MNANSDFEDTTEWWGQFFPTIKFDARARNTKNPMLNLAKMSPEVFSYLKQVMDMGHTVCFIIKFRYLFLKRQLGTSKKN